ncbi:MULTISPECIES: MarR family winged helix-turn-helix transcriptional regulator [Methylophaga]|uniref:Putative HTH-type transcriptional regulator n=1 Tax=Methylophaga muralis TaxID=291169 RepID=A0A1E3GWX1_9GAMM|nr:MULTISPECIES: MarR family transcriptional regulator [Methylophaga]MDO8827389.1 MarR family transcriptional regulator [Methylophaga sp.]ODN67851.1 putative HTH-type transcriptional regulator [Methylophaga muralis]THF54484.1 MAG: MarR family transcriptional regulator [Methylophaga nitratireducenticrescens]THK42471.1 MarR family transcriptional regulator [Methylophaga sp. SB9B]
MADRILTIEDSLEQMRNCWNGDDLAVAETIKRLFRARELFFSDAKIVMEQFNLNVGEFDTLVSLRLQGPPFEQTPSNICQANLVTSGGLTKVLNSLEKADLISRRQCADDQRSRLVKLTDKGKKLIEEALGIVLARHEKQLSDSLTRDERDMLNTLLRKINQLGMR